jgi:hypothetical protein
MTRGARHQSIMTHVSEKLEGTINNHHHQRATMAFRRAEEMSLHF